MRLTLEEISKAVTDAAALLPRQGPITKFAFLNPLQGLEHEHYDEVMKYVGTVYGNEAYLDDRRYREKLWRGRIVESDLREVLSEELGPLSSDVVAGLTPRLELRLATLLHPLHFGERRELDWVLAETESLKHFRPEVSETQKNSLLEEHLRWTIESKHAAALATIAEQHGCTLERINELLTKHELEQLVASRSRETFYLSTLWRIIRNGIDIAENCPKRVPTENQVSKFAELSVSDFLSMTSDSRVDALMIQFTSAFLDQGYASSSLPGVEQGYWNCFRLLYSRPALLAPKWRRSLRKDLKVIEQAGLTPLESIQVSLEELQVRPPESAAFISATLLSLRGYAGMIWQTESRADLFRKSSPPGTLLEFLAVRLLLLTLARKRKDWTLNSPAKNSAAVCSQGNRRTIDSEQLAFILFELAQVLQWSPKAMSALSATQWQELTHELHEFDDHQRRRAFHAAFERQLAKMALRSFWIRTQELPVRPKTPTLQVVCCIDAREESLRRHLEEIDASVETYGIAGFFGVAMYYRGAGDADFSALCPIIMKPRHWVTEEAVYSLEQADRTRAKARRFLGSAQRGFQAQSRGLLGGAIMSTLVGPLATIPMLSRIMLPRTTAMMNQTARQFIAPPTITRLHLERTSEATAAPPTVNEDGTVDDCGVGFTLEEMTQMAERALRDIGLTSNFAPIVLLLGHCSSCINNPHESAYHCGACAGNAGGPNARALAMMLNDVRVRRKLDGMGLTIPEETQFIGGQHNTATEEMMFFDLELLPTRKIKQVRAASQLLAEAARRNAHERCRRFESADLRISNKDALLHVQNRSEDLAQTRPEYGNGSNAICFVGRRQRIRGLFLDRRSFLMSYDATQDSPESHILARILSAVVPVCEGINLLYSFSAIDPSGWGSGTKLPHNITSLVGVMDGAASDLRTGLPWQGVDIHEPVRLLFIIEATTQDLLKLMEENQTLKNIFRNHWSHLATLDPKTNQMYRFSKDKFVLYEPETNEPRLRGLPRAAKSRDWYQGRREHLTFAFIADSPNADAIDPKTSSSNTNAPARVPT